MTAKEEGEMEAFGVWLGFLTLLTIRLGVPRW